jgi:hypothetical protein
VPGQELAVFSGEDVVRHCGYGESRSKLGAESEHEGRLPGAYGSGEISTYPYSHTYTFLHCERGPFAWL